VAVAALAAALALASSALTALALAPAAFAAPGAPDPLFAAQPTPVGAANAYPKAVVVQPDGGIVTAVDAYDARRRRFGLTLVRHTAAGLLDREVATPLATPTAAAVEPGGSIVVAAGRRIARFTPQLALERMIDAPSGATAAALAVGAGGQVAVAAERQDGTLKLVTYTATLEPRTSTLIEIPGRTLSAAGVAFDGAGRPLVGGTAYDVRGASESAPFVARSSHQPVVASGGRLTSFRASALAVTPDGRALVVGSGRDPYEVVLAVADPERDTLATIPFAGADAFATSAAAGPGGALTVAGSVSAGRSIVTALLRLTPGGALDPTFTPPRLPAPEGAPAALAIDPRGGIVLARSLFTDGREELALSRFDGGGAPATPGTPRAP
jgi:hypothetical protein